MSEQARLKKPDLPRFSQLKPKKRPPRLSGPRREAVRRLPICLVQLIGLYEVSATVLLPAVFVAFKAEGLLFAKAHGAQAVGRDTLRDQVLFDRRAALVAVALNGNF